MIIKRTYQNGIVEKMTVLSAAYANQDHSSMVVQTKERGAVILDSLNDATAEMFQDVANGDIEVAEYVIPAGEE
jgi:alpha-D-ribose 1-methylphosphonate 5-triphosphate diphosphatase PhnM